MKRFRLLLTMSMMMLLLLSACDSSDPLNEETEEVVLMAAEETSVSIDEPNTNFNNDLLVVADYPSYHWFNDNRSYVAFDLSSIPANATVVEARVELYFYTCDGDNDIAVYPAAGSWKASELTWNNQPGPVDIDNPLDVVDLNPQRTPGVCGDLDEYVALPGGMASKVGWYITLLAQAWVNGSPNHGVVFTVNPGRPQPGLYLGFFGSSENTPQLPAKPPRLRLRYELR